MRKLLISAAVGMAVGALPMPAHALLQVCHVAATPLAFGTYNPASLSALSGSGTITLTCSAIVSLLDAWTLSLDAGSNGSFAARKMASGSSLLSYNLYTNAAHSTIWGDGSPGTSTVSDAQTLAIGTSTYVYTVYGQVTALQDRAPGSYMDTITVTVDY